MTRWLTGFCLLISLPVLADLQLKHVEPANWWVGMHSSQLQIMLYGEQVSGYQPSLDYPGVKLVKAERVDSPNYLFLTLNLAKDVKPGLIPIKLSQGDHVALVSDYPLLTRDNASAERQGFSNKDSIYLITPDRFANGDLSNDSAPGLEDKLNRAALGGRHGGDLQGIINHLDYIQAMGFTQIWLNPVVENAMPSYSYHGYAATDLYRVDPRYGSNALYQQLAQQAKARGIGVIIDVVLNHIGSQHWWMRDLPSADWLNFAGQFVPTTHRREALHDPYANEWDKRHFSDGWFVETMPDLNQRNPLLATYLIQNSIWWVEYAGLSGIRIDTYSYSDPDFLSQYTARLMAEYPNLNMVGEEWTLNPSIVAYWQRGTQRHDGYQSALPSLFDFPLQAAVVGGLTNKENWNSGLREIYLSLANDYLYGHPQDLVVMPDNHDMSRIFTQLREDPQLWRMAMVLFATVRGTPQFFYGTEILLANPNSDDHGEIRADFPGGWPGDKQNALTGNNLSTDASSAQAYMRKLLNWRKTAQAVHNGRFVHYAPLDGSYSYFRLSEKHNLLVVLNKNDQSIKLDLARMQESLKGFTSAKEVLSGQTAALPDILVPGRSAGIYELYQ
ncbi:cyclomaltodextrinase N-terminal domain-containing protein [Bowmanella sp. Y26]|nr:cyclomaltodextrinase N-terminal domain-containing protein [Bowmanella yangjiangensis]